MPTAASYHCHSRAEYEQVVQPPKGVSVGAKVKPLDSLDEVVRSADGCFGPILTTAVPVVHLPRRLAKKRAEILQRHAAAAARAGKHGVSEHFDDFYRQAARRRAPLEPLGGNAVAREQLHDRQLDDARPFVRALGGIGKLILEDRDALPGFQPPVRRRRADLTDHTAQQGLSASSFCRNAGSFFDGARGSGTGGSGKADRHAHRVWLQSLHAQQVDAQLLGAEERRAREASRLNASAKRQKLRRRGSAQTNTYAWSMDYPYAY
eukprot:g6726.t1